MTGSMIFISTWFGIGFLCMFGAWISDMRGKEFDKDYFSEKNVLLSLFILLLGYLSLIIWICAFNDKNKPFTKLIYKIANIGVKKNDKNKIEIDSDSNE